jgi:hypothetical protein
MDESFDHAVRSERQLERFRDYIRENPQKAGLKEEEFALWGATSKKDLQPQRQAEALPHFVC